MVNNINITWTQLESLINNIIVKLYQDDFRPDCVIGFQANGSIPGVILANKIFAPFCAIHYIKGNYVGIDDIKIDIKNGHKILIINDIDLPEVLIRLRDEIKSSNLQFASLINYNYRSQYDILYSGIDHTEKNEDTCFTFPWEYS